MPEILLQVKDLKTVFEIREGTVCAVDGVSFEIYKGETLAIVGESGSGKSQTAFSILRLIPDPPGKIVGGQVLWQGKDLLAYNEKKMQKVRGNEISMIFQEPMTSLNPVHTVGRQIMEVVQLHQKLNKKEAHKYALDMLHKVGIPDPEQRIKEYPHQMSGGMRQRVMIAMALACNPQLLIADEPTTALDVTIQAQILDEMEKLRQEMNMSIMMITHDLGVVAEMADRVVVMYAGQVVEEADVYTLFEHPRHPYTKGLLQSMPVLGSKKESLYVIDGTVPNPLKMPQGCRFHPRCPYAQDKCKKEAPPLVQDTVGKWRCWFPLNMSGEV